MKHTKRWLAKVLLLALCASLLFPLTVYGESREIPAGSVDPISAIGLGDGPDGNVHSDFTYEFWSRAQEIRLVPIKAFVIPFDIWVRKEVGAEGNDGSFPISGETLVIKRGEVIPEYQLDFSYGPGYYEFGGLEEMGASGHFIMKNIQFGNTPPEEFCIMSGSIRIMLIHMRVGRVSETLIMEEKLFARGILLYRQQH